MLTQIDEKWTQSEYLLFKENGYYRVGGKTKEYLVTSRTKGTYLGNVHWYNLWRQFCFFPDNTAEIILDVKCLNDIAEFCRVKTAEYKGEGAKW